MIREALHYFQEQTEKRHQTVNGQAYYRNGDNKLEKLESPLALATALEFHSLSGLVSYLASGHDEARPAGAVQAIVVDAPDCVRIIGPLAGPFRQREVLAVAKPYLAQPFPYGRYIEIEDFVTELQSKFVPDENAALVLKVVGNIQQESVQTLVDDGVTQQVTARAGIGKLTNVTVPNPVSLRPFRTFSELPQPDSKFVLRMRRNEGELPDAALFETGDAQWKGAATALIKTHLDKLLDEAGVKVQVFA